MRREALQLSPRHRRVFHAIMLALFASGAAWLALPGDAGAPHPLAPTLLRLHGAAAMAALILFGTLLPLHVSRGWRARLNRGTGAAMVGAMALLIVSGYGLYYAGGEQFRRATALAHDALGLALPVLLACHIARGRAQRPTAAPAPPKPTDPLAAAQAPRRKNQE